MGLPHLPAPVLAATRAVAQEQEALIDTREHDGLRVWLLHAQAQGWLSSNDLAAVLAHPQPNTAMRRLSNTLEQRAAAALSAIATQACGAVQSSNAARVLHLIVAVSLRSDVAVAEIGVYLNQITAVLLPSLNAAPFVLARLVHDALTLMSAHIMPVMLPGELWDGGPHYANDELREEYRALIRAGARRCPAEAVRAYTAKDRMAYFASDPDELRVELARHSVLFAPKPRWMRDGRTTLTAARVRARAHARGVSDGPHPWLAFVDAVCECVDACRVETPVLPLEHDEGFIWLGYGFAVNSDCVPDFEHADDFYQQMMQTGEELSVRYDLEALPPGSLLSTLAPVAHGVGLLCRALTIEEQLAGGRNHE